ncbi:class I SAM-dependent methyltransferase [Actinomadura flavalba]|uniref:class I SAM-dependent methyltransferase n=1 Tax=Actinomadura flavalba TaxID=1120938 RepID=UPI000360B7AD|nr:class I SAM-dependent methyltransferase [Actinomadura flavalba]
MARDQGDRDGWDARYGTAELIWTAEPNVFVAREAADLPPGRALDLATGEGRNAVWLAGRGWRVTAVDFSVEGLRKARRLAAEHGADIDWILADVRDHRPRPRGYDLVLVAYLHLRAEDLRDVLYRAAEAVAPGGTLLVVGHDLTNLNEGVGGPRDPSVLYTATGVAAALNGLEVVRADRVTRVVVRGEIEHTAFDTLVRAVRPG